MLIKLIVVLAYAAVIVLIGVIGYKRTKSFLDFFLGGGKVGPWLTAFTYGTAYFSAVLFIGFAGKVGWAFGLSGLWIALGNSLIGVFLVWWLLGNRVKTASTKLKAYTMPEYLDARYDSSFLKIFSSIAIFIFFVPYTAAVYMGLSYLFEVNFGIQYWQALAFIAAFTGIYMVMGGYKSMTMIDFVFGIIMTVGVIILLWFCLKAGDGISGIVNKLNAIDPKLTSSVGPPGFWALFSLVFLTSVAPLGMPQLLQKFFAIKDKKAIRTGMIASTCFAILITGTVYFVGALTRIFLDPVNNPAAFSDTVPRFDALMPELLRTVIPQSLSVVMLLLILSASMSTLAALVLISSSTIARDLYKGFINT
ncbi:sodium:solute symporter, partial [bacterium]